VVGIRHVHEDDQILLVSETGMLIRMNVEEISRIGRVTQGVRLFRIDEDDRVVAVAKLVEKEENGDNGHGDEGNGDNGDGEAEAEAEDDTAGVSDLPEAGDDE